MKKTTYSIVVSGLLIALSVVLTRVFTVDLIIAGVPASRLAIGYVPIVLSGIILGPGWGTVVGAAADVLGFFIFPKGTYFPLITLTSALAGLIPGLIVLLTKKRSLLLQVVLCVSATQVICSMLLQTYFLTLLYGKAFAVLIGPRAIVALIAIPVYCLIVYPILIGLKRARLLPAQPGSKMDQKIS
jgi:riboflavin transporter